MIRRCLLMRSKPLTESAIGDVARAAVCRQLGLTNNVAEFLEKALKEDMTVPFVARYRRHLTGGLNETQVEQAFESIVEQRNIVAAKAKILADLEKRNLMTPMLKQSIEAAGTMTQLEALYQPYRVTRKTNAAKGREAGLDKWSEYVLKSDAPLPAEFFRIGEEEKELVGALLIEAFAQVPAAILAGEEGMRQCVISVSFSAQGRKASVKELTPEEFTERQSTYKNYNGKRYFNVFDSLEAHNVFAIFRGEAQGFLKVNFEVQKRVEATIVNAMQDAYPAVRGRQQRRDNASRLVQESLQAACHAHVLPHAERIVRQDLKKKAQTVSLRVFRDNLRRLLTQRPLRGHSLLAVDPGLGNGCKYAVLSDTGAVLACGKFFIHHLLKEDIRTTPKLAAELRDVRAVIHKHKVTRIAVGDGTASYEAETAMIRLVTEDRELQGWNIQACRCSEHGASIYSASEVAKEELGHLDLLYRSAVSIGRRVLDPLSEYVKIPVHSIGVGLYQHDIAEKTLEKALRDATVSVVAQVGVDINTASKYVLAKVPGLNEKLADAIVNYRSAVGTIGSRRVLKNIPGMTPSVFLKSAGFVRVPNSTERLDDTAVHPETYDATKKILARAGIKLASDSWDVVCSKLHNRYSLSVVPSTDRPSISVLGDDGTVPIVVPSFPSGDDLVPLSLDTTIAKELSATVGLAPEQINQILSAICAPRIDPRDSFNLAGIFAKEFRTISALRVGQRLLGRVENVVAFGAWLDVGVELRAFAHVTCLVDETNRPIGNVPIMRVLAPCDVVTCIVLELPSDEHAMHKGRVRDFRVSVVVPAASVPSALRAETRRRFSPTVRPIDAGKDGREATPSPSRNRFAESAKRLREDEAPAAAEGRPQPSADHDDSGRREKNFEL